MPSHSELGEYLKIGQLARCAEVTVKTLHHYHHLGLLVPSHETPSGHRLYTQEDLERLKQIRALRAAGFPLSQIKFLVLKRNADWKQFAEQHRAFLNEKTRLLRQQTEWVKLAVQTMRTNHQQKSFSEAIQSAQLLCKYFSTRQLKTLSLRVEERGSAWLAQWKLNLRENLQALHRAQQNSVPVRTPMVGKLLQERKSTFDEITRGSKAMARSFRRMYLGETNLRRERGISPTLHEFIECAMKVHGAATP